MIDFKFGVTLDVIKPDDLEQMLKWRNNKSIWAYCRQSDLIPYANHLDWYHSLKTSDHRMYSIKSPSNQFIGVCGLTDINTIARRAEFSCYLGPEYHRKGHGSDALKTLFKHGFQNINLNLIWGECIEGNGALELFKKLGMVVEGVRRSFYYKDGEYKNATLVSIKRDECAF